MAGQTDPQLADRVAAEGGWSVLSPNFRGTGTSQGQFSLAGWLADLQASIARLLAEASVEAVWLCGFGAGGGLALCAAAGDDGVRGVASFSAPADFADWAGDPNRLLALARTSGAVRGRDDPADFASWSRDLVEIRPSALVDRIPPRPLLIVHGVNDEVVPVLDSRVLAEAADQDVELRILQGAGHLLRHDPRAIAILLGWLDRQVP
jgi:putative redox protein